MDKLITILHALADGARGHLMHEAIDELEAHVSAQEPAPSPAETAAPVTTATTEGVQP